MRPREESNERDGERTGAEQEDCLSSRVIINRQIKIQLPHSAAAYVLARPGPVPF